MFFLNLSLGQFLALFGAVSAAAVMLYLLDRSRRKQVVSTLRFWIAAEEPPLVRRRKRIQQPMSLLLQILSMLLLLLAIAQPRLGTPLGAPRDHVLILDTSAWMSARSGGSGAARSGRRSLMDEARESARAYLKSVPAADRVMLVRADALATPVTAFESNRKKLEEAIARSAPGSTALNLDQALVLARQTQALASRRSGEIVYVGAGRVAEQQPGTSSAQAWRNLRVLPITDNIENCGLRKIGVQRSASHPDVWEIYVSTRNYGSAPKAVTLSLTFGGAPAGARRLSIPPGADRETTFEYRTRAAGLLEANLLPRDAFPDDDRAVLELPAQPSLPVTVYSDEPDLLRPVLAASPRVKAVFRSTAQYGAGSDTGLVILDRFRPAGRPASDSVWIDPPAEVSPIPVRARLEGAQFERWCPDHPLCAGLRTRDLRLAAASVFECAPDDVKIGQVQDGPVIVARGGKPKTVVFGFHPAVSDMRYELATPLLFANILRWMEPELFRHSAVSAAGVGMVSVEVDPGVRPPDLRVLEENGNPLPFTLRDRTLRFFTATPGTVRVIAADRELVYSLTLPQLWESRWEAPAGVKRGMPALGEAAAGSWDLWPALAALGGLGLAAEWVLFGRMSRIRKWPKPLAVIRPRIRKAS